MGIVRYDVYERFGTTGAQVFVQSMPTTTYTKNVARGTTYCYQVRAFDAAGNVGVGQERCSGVPFDDADPQIVPTGDVARIASANAFTATLSVLDGTGEQLSYSFTGRKVGIVTRRDASSGMADIFLDGVFMTRVDLYSTTVRDKVLAWERVVERRTAHGDDRVDRRPQRGSPGDVGVRRWDRVHRTRALEGRRSAQLPRRTKRRSLPVGVRGRSSTTSNARGTLCEASLTLQ